MSEKLEDTVELVRVGDIIIDPNKLYRASDLLMDDYITRHDTMRKQVGSMEICYRISKRNQGYFEFAAVVHNTEVEE